MVQMATHNTFLKTGVYLYNTHFLAGTYPRIRNAVPNKA